MRPPLQFNAADWWKGFDASRLKRGCSAEWRRGFEDAREVDHRLNMKAAKGREPYNPDLCVNCFEPIPTKRIISALYCSNACQQIAEGVRGLRLWAPRPGNVLNMDEIAQRQRFVCCAVSKDGYDKRVRRVSDKLRESVFQRAGHKCELCGGSPGKPFEFMLTIQHMRGASNDPMDLKAYCRQCNNIAGSRFATARQLAGYNEEQLARLNLVKVENPDELREPHIEVLMREIKLRVLADSPLLPCDDADEWKNRFKEFQAKRSDYIEAKRAIAAKPRYSTSKRAIAAKARMTNYLRHTRTGAVLWSLKLCL